MDVGGIGFRASLSSHAAAALPPRGEEAVLPTTMTVREDGVALFAFADEAERQAFRALTGVSGVGARTALAVLSSLRPDALARAIAAEDLGALTAVSGIGRKTAQRIVLELRGALTSAVPAVAAAGTDVGLGGTEREAYAALLALGYSDAEAGRALAATQGTWGGTAELVRAALRTLAQG